MSFPLTGLMLQNNDKTEKKKKEQITSDNWVEQGESSSTAAGASKIMQSRNTHHPDYGQRMERGKLVKRLSAGEKGDDAAVH